MKKSIQQKIADWESAFNSMNNLHNRQAQTLRSLILEARLQELVEKSHPLSGVGVA